MQNYVAYVETAESRGAYVSDSGLFSTEDGDTYKPIGVKKNFKIFCDKSHTSNVIPVTVGATIP